MSQDIRGTAPDTLRSERIRAMTSPHHVIDDDVLEACGGYPIVARTRITEGFSNEVYALTTAEGQRVGVRIDC